MNDKDYLIFNIKDFNQYDSYSKEDYIYITDDMIDYYKDLLKKYFLNLFNGDILVYIFNIFYWTVYWP